jgi:hypothetical protein
MYMKLRRFLAWVVTALILLTSLSLPGPLSAVRETAASSALAAIKEAAAEKDEDLHGQCGINLFWVFHPASGELAITGSGYMYDYADHDRENPWIANGINDQIVSVSLPKGLTSIGKGAFYSFSSLKNITLPGRVKTIGEEAFSQCTALQAIVLPISVTRIDAGAFLNCSALTDVHYLSTAANRVRICIYRDNEDLLQANWHYTRTSIAGLAIKSQPRNIRVNEGKTATFKVRAAGATMIRWQYLEPDKDPSDDSNWKDTGVTADTLSVMGSTRYDGYRYRAKVSNGGTPLPSSAATLTVVPVTLAIKASPRTVRASEGKTVTFRTKAVGATHYQWYQVTPEGTEDPVAGATSSTLTRIANRDDDGCMYYCRVSNDRGGELDSNRAQLCVRITIRKQPRSVKVGEGYIARFTVTAVGHTDLQWERQQPGSRVWEEVEGAVEETYSLLAKRSDTGTVYRCRLKNNTSVKYSSKVKLTVTASTITILSQPQSIAVDLGRTATFTVAAQGATGYQWQYKPAGESDWTDAPGDDASTAAYAVAATVENNGSAYRCLLSNSTSTLCSDAALLTVSGQVTILSQPRSAIVKQGDPVTFATEATSTVGSPAYQWQWCEPNSSTWNNVVGSAANSLQLSADAGMDGRSYRCKVSSGANYLYTDTVTLTVLSIVSQPISVYVPEGQTATFTVAATGATGYQWESRKPDETAWSVVSGATSAAYALIADPSNDGCSYRCKVSNGTLYLYTDPVTLTLRTAKYRALLIGENDYPDNPLNGCVNDMTSMAGMLQGLSNGYVTTTLPNSTKDEILSAIGTVFADATGNDTSLFYYSGHGYGASSTPRHGALVPVDEQIITFSQLADALAQTNGRVIVILDSCFSGAAINKAAGSNTDTDANLQAYNQAVIAAFSGYYMAPDGTATRERTTKAGELAQSKFIVITASSQTETSYDGSFDSSYEWQGLFTAAFIQGMGCTYPNGAYSGSMPADTDGNGQITLDEIYTYAHDTAIAWVDHQHAQCYGSADEVLFYR